MNSKLCLDHKVPNNASSAQQENKLNLCNKSERIYHSGKDIPRHKSAQKDIFIPFGQEDVTSARHTVGIAGDSCNFL